MGLAKLYARALSGMHALEVIVEVHVSGGLPSFSIVGLPDIEVRESRDRVRSAIQMSGFEFPARRITVNLAPADLPKDSGRYDLAIALGILIAAGLVKPNKNVHHFEFAGELALDGALRKINGALAIAYSAVKSDRAFVLPENNALEASLVDNVKIFSVNSLKQVVDFLCGTINLFPYVSCETQANLDDGYLKDFAQVKGQLGVKKALEIAASGRHSVLMSGNPGCGKSMLAQRMTSILPNLSTEEAIQTASIYSLVDGFSVQNWRKVPFRQPHHSCSSVALVGGGSFPKPGEISLAHNGVLFLDEILEFDRRVLEVLREPLETRLINIARANHKTTFPADFQLVAAMNPCPCGNRGHAQNICKCSPEQIARYIGKLSGPLLDRIDLVVSIPQVKLDELETAPAGESSKQIKARVLASRAIQLARQGKLNYALENQEVEEYCQLDNDAKNLLNEMAKRIGISARSYYKLKKIARTIADLADAKVITKEHIAQSLQFRVTF